MNIWSIASSLKEIVLGLLFVLMAFKVFDMIFITDEDRYNCPKLTKQERWSKNLDDAWRGCLHDYPTEEQLLMEQGWTYEECAIHHARFAMHLEEQWISGCKSR